MDKKPRRSNWVELRTSEGKLACKYDPRRRLIEYVHRGQRTIFDLMEMAVEKEEQVVVSEVGERKRNV